MPAVDNLQQLLTYHGTVVFLDIGSGKLRHGQAASSPRNVFLVLREGTGYLVHAGADGRIPEIRVAPGLTPPGATRRLAVRLAAGLVTRSC